MPSTSSSGEYDYEAINFDWEGCIFKDTYIAFVQLGYGAHSTVWMCYSLKDKKCYAIKICNADCCYVGKKENDILKTLQHPTIIKLVDSFVHKIEDDEYFCMIMELMTCSTQDLINIYEANNKTIPNDVVRQITIAVTNALAFMHSQGIMHADIKPENILVKCKNNITKYGKLESCINNTNITNLINVKKLELMRKSKKDSSIKNIAIKAVVEKILEEFYSDEDNSDDCEEEEEEEQEEIEENMNNDLYQDILKDHIIPKEILYNFDCDEDDECDEDEEDEDEINSDTDTELQNTDETLNLEIIDVRVTDFGSCVYKNKNTYMPIQTRYYMAPEVVTKLKYDEKCDMWSLGCVIYELITGEILFNINDNESDIISTDRYHMQLFHNELGEFPKTMIDASPCREIFWKKNYEVKGDKIKPYDAKMMKLSENKFSEIIKKLLEYEAADRLSAAQLIEYLKDL